MSKESAAAWRKANPGRQAELCAAWRKNNPEKVAAYSKMHESRLLRQEQKAVYHKAHPELRLNWMKRNPEKVKAHHVLYRAVKRGKIVRPERCEMCGRKARIEGHHSNYSKPLDVDWLCRPCHAGLRI